MSRKHLPLQTAVQCMTCVQLRKACSNINFCTEQHNHKFKIDTIGKLVSISSVLNEYMNRI